MKHLSDKFSIKNSLEKGDALWPLPFPFALEYAVRKFMGNQEDFKLKGIYQFWFVLMTLTYWVEAYIPQREKQTP